MRLQEQLRDYRGYRCSKDCGYSWVQVTAYTTTTIMLCVLGCQHPTNQ